ncbi:RDD family protein [Georgenia sp. SYP-B2076]|uniref:RDD family protein n=1 Tax=Georgenia sp. SYP-B2076 TaxID=2495881 RepID=UPI000F8EAFB9|nr:RDD family protein [Georgenia sp. SYP-B2076]
MPAATSSPSLPVAGLGRRIIALVVDWGIASAISAGFFQYDALATLGIFAVMTWLLVATLGATIGHLVTGLGVRTPAGGPAGPLRALVRTVALCLVVPAVVWGPDGRGLHDVWAGTVITRLRSKAAAPAR